MSLTLYIRDSRRLTGPSRFWDRPSAILDVGAPESEEASESNSADGQGDDTKLFTPPFRCSAEDLIASWEKWAQRLLQAIGWEQEHTAYRAFREGIDIESVSLLISAPIDALYAATEVNEAAFDAALKDMLRGPLLDFDSKVEELRTLIAEESNPDLLRLKSFAKENDLLFLSDDDFASVGGGTGSRTWPVDELPSASELAASQQQGHLHNIKIAALSGTNGKSTTVRLLSAMAAAAKSEGGNLVPGVTSTDWIKVGDEIIETGDYSGPGGARTLLRDRRVDLALLEAARGGLNRRGLGVPGLDVAALTNIGSDHLGEHGCSGKQDLLDTKWTIARVADRLVLNLDDPLLRTAGLLKFPPGDQRLIWCSLEADDSALRQHLEAGGEAVVFHAGNIVALSGAHEEALAAIEDVPMTLGGAARHNIANALIATATARSLGLSSAAIQHGLRTFATDPADNPGRLTEFSFPTVPKKLASLPSKSPAASAPEDHDRVRVLVDFAHNPEGVDALLAMAEDLAPARWLITLGQAGDRDDESIRALAETAWRYQPNKILIKELDAYRRGREAGEVPQMIEDRLIALGADPDLLQRTADEWDSVATALRWARPADLLILIIHSHRDLVLERLSQLSHSGWAPGQELPTFSD